VHIQGDQYIIDENSKLGKDVIELLQKRQPWVWDSDYDMGLVPDPRGMLVLNGICEGRQWSCQRWNPDERIDRLVDALRNLINRSNQP
jgi:hypothetical protein